VHTHQVSVSVPASSSWEPLAVSARSNRAAATGRVWDSCICEMPFVVAEFDPQEILFFHYGRAFRV
jgi:hypothetical protein